MNVFSLPVPIYTRKSSGNSELVSSGDNTRCSNDKVVYVLSRFGTRIGTPSAGIVLIWDYSQGVFISNSEIIKSSMQHGYCVCSCGIYLFRDLMLSARWDSHWKFFSNCDALYRPIDIIQAISSGHHDNSLSDILNRWMLLYGCVYNCEQREIAKKTAWVSIIPVHMCDASQCSICMSDFANSDEDCVSICSTVTKVRGKHQYSHIVHKVCLNQMIASSVDTEVRCPLCRRQPMKSRMEGAAHLLLKDDE